MPVSSITQLRSTKPSATGPLVEVIVALMEASHMPPLVEVDMDAHAPPSAGRELFELCGGSCCKQEKEGKSTSHGVRLLGRSLHKSNASCAVFMRLPESLCGRDVADGWKE